MATSGVRRVGGSGVKGSSVKGSGVKGSGSKVLSYSSHKQGFDY